MTAGSDQQPIPGRRDGAALSPDGASGRAVLPGTRGDIGDLLISLLDVAQELAAACALGDHLDAALMGDVFLRAPAAVADALVALGWHDVSSPAGLRYGPMPERDALQCLAEPAGFMTPAERDDAVVRAGLAARAFAMRCTARRGRR